MSLEKLRETKKNILEEKERVKKEEKTKEDEKVKALSEFLTALDVFRDEVENLDGLTVNEAETLINAYFENATRIYDDPGFSDETATFGNSIEVLFYGESLPEIEYFLYYI